MGTNQCILLIEAVTELTGIDEEVQKSHFQWENVKEFASVFNPLHPPTFQGQAQMLPPSSGPSCFTLVG